MAKDKQRYEIDPHNRLVFAETSNKSKLPKYRKVLDGRFKTDENNTLTYHVKSSPDYDAPQQIKLKGNWSLDENHNLILALDKWNNQVYGNRLTLKGDLIDAKDNELSFAITTKDSTQKTKIYIFKLGGSWQADKYNRLTFNVTRKEGTTDKLTLTGTWEINKQNQIIYTYSKSHLKTKEKTENTITLKGYWNVTEKCRLLYVLNKKLNSQFDFKVSLGKPAQRGLQYELGIGATPRKKKIKIFGEWKVNKKLGLLFEVPYEKGQIKSIVFGAKCKLRDGYNLDFKLKNEFGKDLGMTVKLSKKILKDQGEIFLERSTTGKEKQIMIGAGWMW